MITGGDGVPSPSLAAGRGKAADADAGPRRRTLGRRAAHVLEAVGLLCFLGLCRALPVDWASAMGNQLGRAIGPHLAVSRRALRNVQRAMPATSPAECRRIVLDMWGNLGRVAAEYAHLPQICDPASGRVEVRNGEIVTNLGHDKHPSIIFGGHFANWEVGPYVLRGLLGRPLTSVYREPNNPWIGRLLHRLRRAPDSIGKGADGGRALVRLLRRGGHVGILVDQKLNDGIAVPFLGRDAMTAPAIGRLGLRYGCTLVPARAERLEGARFRVTILPPLAVEPTGDDDNDVRDLMVRINAMLESWVLARPEQWLWVHNRWPN